ncbi:peptide MFS transporter [Fulvivirga sedimenti]|uniref:Oligopeptide:H+ symporter n=1 Tax=Fulvivirga sedimenti TaxID=2879465 RepID=A0A9X1HM43_9BACT|nr:oligopeptide:H+ symporter [Fulvivirga sedimenti]MCA6073358.1 oligopeptide:H+ symporter [Fulvivirga sedimenti]
MENSGSQSTFFGHPRGLATLFFTEMWERFSYYGMRAILILFMTTEAAQQGLGMDNVEAGAIYGLYTAAVYLLTLPGGWIADNVIGQRKAIWYGGILIMIGHALLAIPGNKGIFIAGLAFVATGTGFLKPNISSIVGDLYPEGGARRDAGFSVFYMGINLGSFLGQTLVSLFATWNWHYGFGLAAIGMLFGLIQYRLTADKHLGSIGIQAKAKEDRIEKNKAKTSPVFAIATLIGSIALLLIAQFAGWVDLTSAEGVALSMAYIIPGITFIYLLYIIVAGDITVPEKKQVFVIFVLFLGAACFWAGFEQAGSTLNLFANDYTDRILLGYEIPPGWLQNFNPFFIIILAPIFGALWIKLAAKNLNPSTPLKFGFGLVLMGLGFLVMVFAAKAAAVASGGASMTFLILTYFLHSSGELTLSPVGLSATTKLAPKAYSGQMMGIWFVATSVGNLIAGLYAGGFDSEDVTQLPDLFMSVVWLGVGAGLTFIVISGLLRKWMGNVH